MKYKYSLAFLLSFFLLSLSLHAESEKHIMWQVNSNTATVYLLGSIHVAKSGFYPLDSVITNAFERSKYLVVEIDMNKADIFSIMQKAYFKGDDELKAHLDDKTYFTLKAEFDKLEIQESFYSKMKPWFAVLTLMNLKLSDEGFESEQGIDMYFMNEAAKKNMDILELESAAFQITMLDSIMSSMQDEFVMYSLQDFDSTDSFVDDMFDYWLAGDVDKLQKLAFEQYEDLPNAAEFEKAFLFDRNIGMADKINEYLQTDDTYFVVVGAAHLLGDKGVVRLLENLNKYKINQK